MAQGRTLTGDQPSPAPLQAAPSVRHPGVRRTLFQPIWRLSPVSLVGLETLALLDDATVVSGPGCLTTATPTREALDLVCELIGQAADLHHTITGDRESDDLLVSVNICPACLDEPDAARRILEAASSPWDRERASWLTLEISPASGPASTRPLSATAASVPVTREQIWALVDAGVGFAIDDFGAVEPGFVRELTPWLRMIKLQADVTRRLATDDDVQGFFARVASVCRELDTMAVADGIDRLSTLADVIAARFQAVQGELVGAPMPAGEIQAAIADGSLKRDFRAALHAAAPADPRGSLGHSQSNADGIGRFSTTAAILDLTPEAHPSDPTTRRWQTR